MGFGNTLSSVLSQVLGDRDVQRFREKIEDSATPEELANFDRNQERTNKWTRRLGYLSGAHALSRDIAEGKFRPTSTFNTGYNTMLTARGIANPRQARIDANKIAERVDSEPERVGRTQAPVASSTYVEPAAEFRTVDPAMLSEERQINPIRTPSPQEQRLVGVTPQQRVFTQRFAGGPVKVIPKAEPTPEHKMTERQVKVLAPTAPTAPTTQSNLNQFTEKDMVRIINQDDTEDAREEKRLNAQNLDGSKQIQGNV
jgi:hypothetical protein